MAAVSVIIVAWNARRLIGRCLSSLAPFRHEILVVDNASTDGTADFVALSFPQVTLVRAPLNLGFAGAVNFASRRLSGEFLLLLNPDILASDPAIETMASLLESHPDCAAVAARLEDDTAATGVRRLPTLGSIARDLLLLDKLPAFHPTAQPSRPGAPERPGPVEVELPSTACLMLRRSAFEAVGRMDEAFYPAWFEDADLCRRLRRGGWRIVIDPSAVFGRAGSGATRRQLGYETFTRIWYRNLQRYTRKHYPFAARALVKALIVAGAIERIAITLLRGDRAAALTFARVLGDVFRPKGYARLMDQLSGEPASTTPRAMA